MLEAALLCLCAHKAPRLVSHLLVDSVWQSLLYWLAVGVRVVFTDSA